MSRLVTDDLYIELGYFTPEEYYAYQAQASLDAGFYIDPDYIEQYYYEESGAFATLACELTEVEGQDLFADAQISSTATVNAVVGVIKEHAVALTAEFSVVGSISHIEGADLFAFAEAALAAAVAASREYSASVDSVFDCATDYVRFRSAAAEADSEFQQSAEGARSRDFDSQIEAAVSLDCTADANTKEASATLTVSASVSAQTSYSVFMPYTRFENAFVFGATASPYNPGRPLTQTANTLGEFDYYTNPAPKFGTHSARINTLDYVTYAIPNNSSFNNDYLAIEFWIYGTPTNVPLFEVKSSAGTVRYIAITTSNGLGITFGVTTNAFRSVVQDGLIANQWNHVLCLAGNGTNNTTIYINGSRGTVNTHSTTNLANGSFKIGGFTGYTGSGYIDEFRVVKGKTSWPNGWNPANTTVTVPTQPFVNDDKTSLLVHFDANANDDISIPIPVVAYLNAETRLSAGVNDIASGASAITSTLSLTASTTTVSNNSATATANFSIDATVGVVKPLTATIDSALSFEINAGAVQPGNIEATIVADLTASGDRTRTVLASATATADASATPNQIKGIVSALSASASLSAEGSYKFKGGVAAITATASISATGTVRPNPVKSLVHFDTLAGGVPIDEYANTWIGAVNSVSTGSAFGNAASFGNNTFYFNDAGVSSPEIETYLEKSDRLNIGVEEFSVDLRVRLGGEFISVSTTTYSIPVFRQYEGLNINETPVYTQGLYVDRSTGVSPVLYTLRFNWPGDGANLEYDIGPDWGNTLRHVAVSRQIVNGNSVWRLFVDGVLRDSLTQAGVVDLNFTANGVGYLLGGYHNIDGRSWFGGTIDEFRLIIGNNPYTENFTPSTVNYGDFIVEYENSTLSAEFSLAAEYLRVKFTEADLTATASQTVVNSRIRSPGAKTVNVVASQSTLGRKIALGVSNQTVTASMNVTARKITDVISTQTLTANQTASGQRVRYAGSALSVSSNLDLPFGNVLKTPSAFLDVTATQTVLNDRFRDNDIQTDSIATQLSVAVKTGQGLIGVDAFVTCDVTAVKQTDIVSNSTVDATFSADPIKTVFGEGSAQAEFTAVIAADKIKRVEASIESNFSVDIPGQKVTDVIGAFNSTAEAVLTPNRIRDNAVDLNTTTNLAVPVTEILILFEAGLTAETSGLFVITYLVNAHADLEVEGFQLSAGRVIHIDDFYTLIVPQENRNIKVQSEDRDLLVKQETRILMV